MTPLLPRLEFLVQALFKRQPKCRFCGIARTAVVARKYAAIRVRECPACGLCFTDPAFESWFGNFYDQRYDEGDLTTRLPFQDELQRLRQTEFAGTNKDFRERIRHIRSWAPGTRWLEIGSSWGYFLFQAKAQGVDARGVEIGRVRREFGRDALGVEIRESIEAYGATTFDLVYSNHVLEHFLSLATVFTDIDRILAPGGMLVIEVPNFDLSGRGPAALQHIGAVHPLGLNRRFFQEVATRYGYTSVSFPASYEAGAPESHPSQDHLIVVARKPPRP